MYAVYKEIDKENKLCQCWNVVLNAWMPAIFYFKYDALVFIEETQSVKGHETYKYNVASVSLTNNHF